MMDEMMDQKKITQVTAAILRQDDKILICQRDNTGSCPLLWEFPGGKQEIGESLEECLVRECQEELGITIQVGEVFAESRYTYGEKEMCFTFFESRIIEGELQRIVHWDIRWVRAEELGLYEFCPADVEVAERLRRL
ncbi:MULTISPECIES: (deoxy)nucleoside triphosphate pyrophosphohydrolase [unclassified Dehalobacter]|uniref:(deoxy)nucleoside triphosphate pyrophosphohydrolase n=1 Tax=unclassified Dehalobacter TaxID=2635733 RepID=UPI001FA9CA31|nr:MULTISPECIES: (deoxy)nucleoside triphosphate pyrophosphohydrolase [unclassified Dehalobacter]